MSTIATTIERRACRASGTVKKRISTCGSPHTPSDSARPSDSVEYNELSAAVLLPVNTVSICARAIWYSEPMS